MLKSGLVSVSHNINRQQTDLRLYEIGKTYETEGDSFKEREYITLFLTGKRKEESWLEKDRNNVGFHDVKGIVDQIMAKLGIGGYQINDAEDERLTYGQKYHRGPMVLVSYGEVNATQLSEIGIKSEVFYAEFDLENIIKALKNVNVQIEDISKFPAVNRDLALVIDKGIKFEDIKRLAFKADKKILKEVNLFDTYENEEHIGKGKKSYAISLRFEDIEKTLSDKEIDKIINKMLYLFENELNAELRK
jgi:phenylalanyl-tRNA synthetase beta chain